MNNTAEKVLPFQNDEEQVKPLWDFSEVLTKDPAPLDSFVQHLMIETSGDIDSLTGLVLLCLEITKDRDVIRIEDFCDHVQRACFRETVEMDRAQRKWEEKVRRGAQVRTV